MDDLFQYLIYGIIIISFLSSFFKKKEQPKQTPLPKVKQPDSSSYQQKSTKAETEIAAQKKDEYDILRELENMFKGNVKIPEQPKPKQVDPYDIYQASEIKDKDLNLEVDKRLQRSVQDQSPIGSRTTYDEKKTYDRKNVPSNQKPNRAIDPRIEQGAKEFERILASTRNRKAAVTEFNRKLKNPRTVREYILFSEILGKPKALRR
jgi:hypothetical protein